MIEGTQARMYLSASESFIELWKEDLLAVLEKGKKLVLITDRMPDFFSDRKPIFYQASGKSNQIRLIIDSAYVLTGDIAGESTDTCLYSAQKNFVNVFKEAMGNEIKLIELTGGKAE